MNLKGVAVIPFLVVAVVVVGVIFVAVASVSYFNTSPDEAACISSLGNLKIVDSPYTCVDSSSDKSGLSLVSQHSEDFILTFDGSSGEKTIEVRNGEVSDALRLLNGNFNEPLSYSSGIKTFVYDGSAKSVKIEPIVNGDSCGISDSRVLEPCSSETHKTISLGDDGKMEHLACVNDACSIVEGAGNDSCFVVGAYCGLVSSGGGGGGSRGGGGGSSGGSNTPANQQPIAYFTANQTNGSAPLNVMFNASLSSDPDGTIVLYSWNFGDGNVTDTTNESIEHEFLSDGSYEVVLTVTDNGGLSDSENLTILLVSGGSAGLCGNGIIDVSDGETCDDNNTIDGDGCSSTCMDEIFDVSIIFPSEGVVLNYDSNIGLNYSVVDSSGTLASCKYSLDGATNVSLPSCVNASFDSSEGSHVIEVFATTSAGRTVGDSSSFTINLNAPSINLMSPNDGEYTNLQPVVFYYIPSDSLLQSCSLWGNFSGNYLLNQTLIATSDVVNNFSLNLNEGVYSWAISCTDSLGFNSITSNRTLNVDRTAPQFSSFTDSPLNGSSYSFSALHYFNTSILGNVQSVLLSIDSKQVAINSFGGGIYGAISSSLAAGSHNLIWTVNDSAGNSAQALRDYSLAKASASGTLISSSGWNINYPTTTIIDYAEPNLGDGDLVYIVRRDSQTISVPETILLGAGTYNYDLNVNSGENYSSGFLDSKQLVVSPATSTVNFVLSPASGQTYGTSVNASCIDDNPEAPSILERDGNIVNENNVFVVLGAGTHTYECYVDATQNYTSADSGQVLYVVNQASGDVAAYVNNTRSDLNVRVGTLVPLNATLISGNGNVQIELDGAVVASGLGSVQIVQNFSSAGNYNVTARYLGNENYTFASETWFVSVQANSAPVALFTVNPLGGEVPVNITFNATDSYDPDGVIVDYDWDFGDFSSGNGKVINHVYDTAFSNYIVTLTITDNEGSQNSTSIEIPLSWPSDTQAPQFSNFSTTPTSPAVYASGASYTFMINVSDDSAVDTVILNFNGTNYSTSLSGNTYLKTFNNLGAGNYNYYYIANDTYGNSNSTAGTYTITRATTSLSLNVNPSTTITQGTQTTTTGAGCPSQLSCVLTRNGTSVSNPDVQTLAAGTYMYNYSTNGNNNYTSTSVNVTLLVVAPQCSDNLDNDGDGFTDYPADFSCSNANDNDETNPLAACQDGIDNDGDGWTDLADPGCSSNQDNSENQASTGFQCSNLLDDDGDTLVDGNDPDCTDWTDNDEFGGGTGSFCGNGVIESGETCDDNNLNNNDGCSSICQVESGYTCNGEPSICVFNNLKANIIIREADWIISRRESAAPPSSKYIGTNQTNYYAPLPVFFEGWNSTGPRDIVNYSWDFGDGDVQNYGFNAAHIYEIPGSYTATLTVTDKDGATDSASVSVNVLSPDGTTYYIDSQIGDDSCAGTSQTFDDSVNCPWKTATKAFEGFQNNFYQPGDQVLFKRGQTFGANISMNYNNHWSSGFGYSFGAYGTGDKPVIQPIGASNPGGNYLLYLGGVGVAYITFKDLRFDCTSPQGIKALCYVNIGLNQNILFLRDDFVNSEQGLLSHADGKNQSDLFIVDSNFYNSSVVELFVQSKRVALINNHFDYSGNHIAYLPYLDSAVIIDNIFTRPAFGRTALRIDGEENGANFFDHPSRNVYIGHNFFGGWVDPISDSDAHNGQGNSFNYALINLSPNTATGQSLQNILFEDNTITDSEQFMIIGDAENVTVRNNVFRTVDDSSAGRIILGGGYQCKPSKNVQITNNSIYTNVNPSFPTYVLAYANSTSHVDCGVYVYPYQITHENIAYENNSIYEFNGERTLLTLNPVNASEFYNFSFKGNKIYGDSDNFAILYNSTYYNLAQWQSSYGTAAGTALFGTQQYVSPGLVIAPMYRTSGAIHLWYDYIQSYNFVNIVDVRLMVKKDNGPWQYSGLSDFGGLGSYGLSGTFDYTPSQGDGEYYFALQVEGDDFNLYPSQIDLPMTKTVYGTNNCGPLGCSPEDLESTWLDLLRARLRNLFGLDGYGA